MPESPSIQPQAMEYAVAVWRCNIASQQELDHYVQGDGKPGSGSFATDANFPDFDPDYAEALSFKPPVHLFDLIDLVSYGRSFRSECVKMLYPQQFEQSSALIFVYGRKGSIPPLHAYIFSANIRNTHKHLRYIGTIPFVPGEQA